MKKFKEGAKYEDMWLIYGYAHYTKIFGETPYLKKKKNLYHLPTRESKIDLYIEYTAFPLFYLHSKKEPERSPKCG